MFSKNIITFLKNLETPKDIGEGVTFINPYRNESVLKFADNFYTKYFNDNRKRVIVFGINPGRFGGGLTGIPFTDPVALREKCNIPNDRGNRKELSSEFIYDMINAFGGVKIFYSKVFLTAVYPLALIKDGKNFNYYDNKTVAEKMMPYLRDSFEKQLSFGKYFKTAISLGKKNSEFLSKINREFGSFEKIITLEHPRYIMQYKRKTKDDYIKKYIETINESML